MIRGENPDFRPQNFQLEQRFERADKTIEPEIVNEPPVIDISKQINKIIDKFKKGEISVDEAVSQLEALGITVSVSKSALCTTIKFEFNGKKYSIKKNNVRIPRGVLPPSIIITRPLDIHRSEPIEQEEQQGYRQTELFEEDDIDNNPYKKYGNYANDVKSWYEAMLNALRESREQGFGDIGSGFEPEEEYFSLAEIEKRIDLQDLINEYEKTDKSQSFTEFLKNNVKMQNTIKKMIQHRLCDKYIKDYPDNDDFVIEENKNNDWNFKQKMIWELCHGGFANYKFSIEDAKTIYNDALQELSNNDSIWNWLKDYDPNGVKNKLNIEFTKIIIRIASERATETSGSENTEEGQGTGETNGTGDTSDVDQTGGTEDSGESQEPDVSNANQQTANAAASALEALTTNDNSTIRANRISSTINSLESDYFANDQYHRTSIYTDFSIGNDGKITFGTDFVQTMFDDLFAHIREVVKGCGFDDDILKKLYQSAWEMTFADFKPGDANDISDLLNKVYDNFKKILTRLKDKPEYLDLYTGRNNRRELDDIVGLGGRILCEEISVYDDGSVHVEDDKSDANLQKAVKLIIEYLQGVYPEIPVEKLKAMVWNSVEKAVSIVKYNQTHMLPNIDDIWMEDHATGKDDLARMVLYFFERDLRIQGLTDNNLLAGNPVETETKTETTDNNSRTDTENTTANTEKWQTALGSINDLLNDFFDANGIYSLLNRIGSNGMYPVQLGTYNGQLEIWGVKDNNQSTKAYDELFNAIKNKSVFKNNGISENELKKIYEAAWLNTFNNFNSNFDKVNLNYVLNKVIENMKLIFEKIATDPDALTIILKGCALNSVPYGDEWDEKYDTCVEYENTDPDLDYGDGNVHLHNKESDKIYQAAIEELRVILKGKFVPPLAISQFEAWFTQAQKEAIKECLNGGNDIPLSGYSDYDIDLRDLVKVVAYKFDKLMLTNTFGFAGVLVEDKSADVKASLPPTINSYSGNLDFYVNDKGEIVFVIRSKEAHGAFNNANTKNSTLDVTMNTLQKKLEEIYNNELASLGFDAGVKEKLFNLALFTALSDPNIVRSQYVKVSSLETLINAVIQNYTKLLQKAGKNENAKQFIQDFADKSILSGRTPAPTDNYTYGVQETILLHSDCHLGIGKYYQDDSTGGSDDWLYLGYFSQAIIANNYDDGKHGQRNVNILIATANTGGGAPGDANALNNAMIKLAYDYIVNFESMIDADRICKLFVEAQRKAYTKIRAITDQLKAGDCQIYGYGETGRNNNIDGKDNFDTAMRDSSGVMFTNIGNVILQVMFEMERLLALEIMK